jgi:hypothetical protein
MGAVVGQVKTLARDLGACVRRFPLPLAAGVVGASAGVALLGGHLAVDSDAARVLLTSWLGVSLLLGATLAGERGAPGRLVWSAVAAALLASFYVGLAGHREEWIFIRFALFLIAGHALLALAPLAGPRPRGDFRAFNLMLFSRTALALLMTQALAAGLVFALFAAKRLFDVQIDDERGGQLWFALMGVFNTAFVLAGVPRDWDRLGASFPTPRPLDFLARLVLLPLSALYLAILYAYSVKIIVLREWPRGWVSAPIMVFAALGLLTILLLEPRRLTGSRLVRAFCRGFSFALLPLVGLLVAAISRRALEYGLTEERCLVYAVAGFLAVVGAYFVFSRARNLAVIPGALAVLALLTAAGPLSARALSVRSQTARARALLEKNHLLVHGVLRPAAARVSAGDEHELSAALHYLDERDALGGVLAWRPASDPCTGCVGPATATTAPELVRALGLSYRPWGVETEDRSTRIWAKMPGAIDATGFDLVIPSLNCWHPGPCQGTSNDFPLKWRAALEENALVVRHEDHEEARIPLVALERQATSKENAASPREEPVVIEGRFASGRYRLVVSNLELEREPGPGAVEVKSLDGALLLSLGR